MGASTEDDVERTGTAGGTTPIAVEMVQFIREEVKATVQNELATASAPPSYGSSVPLLIEENEANGEGAQDADKKKPRGWRHRLRVVVVILPFFGVMLSMPLLCITKVDELAVSVLAFFLMMSMYGIVILLAGLSSFFTSKKQKETESDPTSNNTFIGVAIFTWHFWICQMAFAGIIYWWLTGTYYALLTTWRVAKDFDQKIGQKDALGRLDFV